MQEVRWIFFLTESGHAPTAESEKILLDSVLGNEKKRTKVRTFGGPDWTKADRLACNLKPSSIVVVITKEEGGTYAYDAIQGNDNIAKLCVLLHAGHPAKNSYQVAKQFATAKISDKPRPG